MPRLLFHTTMRRPKRLRHRGIQVLEAILALPILIIVTMGAFQIGVSILMHQAVNSAAIEAAREAAKIPVFNTNDTVDVDKVEAVVEEILGAHGMTVDPTSGILVIIEEINNGASMGVACRGDVTNVKPCPAMSTITDADLIKVTVIARFEFTPAPNLLKTFGFNQEGRFFKSCSIARRS